MDTITLESGKVYRAEYAADSLSTGDFVAMLQDTTIAEAVKDFDAPGRITVDNPDTGRHIYDGYAGIHSARCFPDGVLVKIGRDTHA